MCGIVATVGEHALRQFILDGLKSLEYRGYDSAGMTFLNDDKFTMFKIPGRVKDLQALVPETMTGQAGIGHTRWATHGKPSEDNAHPHTSNRHYFSLVHNGVIDNYRILKKKLIAAGYSFYSETDTEVIVNLIEYYYLKYNHPLKAIEKAMRQLEGSYALTILFNQDSQRVYYAKLHSPLVIGEGDYTHYIASDYLPMLAYAKTFCIVTDYQYGYISQDEVMMYHLEQDEPLSITFHEVDLTIEDIGLNGYPHYMLKEIEESPEVIKRLIDNYVDGGQFNFDPVLIEKIKDADSIIFLAAGTSYHAALIGSRYFEAIGKTCRVMIASEFAYYPEIKGHNPLFILISQSGETADLIRCVEAIQLRGSTILTITNTKGSSLDRASDFTLLLYAGIEIAVASTKAYIAQVTILNLLQGALLKTTNHVYDLLDVINAIHHVIEHKDKLNKLSKHYVQASSAFFLGRGMDYDVALEASLKLKEITYIHSEAMPGGELKHGPIALIQEGVPVLAFISDPITAAALRSNLEEVAARGARTIVISNAALAKDEDAFVTLDTKVNVSPLVKSVVGQYLSYYVALALQKDIDKPRNLAKSVTVE